MKTSLGKCRKPGCLNRATGKVLIPIKETPRWARVTCCASCRPLFIERGAKPHP